uniref:CBS domain-containing protein n=1 Tax=Panagrolaimus sp. JU765 TaxID=591449 RepID=A0AC34QWK6_9BILA
MIGVMEQASLSPFLVRQCPNPNNNSPTRLHAMDEELEDDLEVSTPLRSDESDNSQQSSPVRSEQMEVDDEAVESEQLREMRERKRTLSIKLQETVEAFRRMNSNGKSMSSSSGDSNPSPPGRPPKMSCKMPSNDSAVDSSDSRRTSISKNATDTRRDYVRQRRQTMTDKYPARKAKLQRQISERLPSERKTSNDSQFEDDYEVGDDEEFPAPVSFKGRRFSVPEKVLLHADYAILRHQDRGLEFLGAFNRNDEPLKHYMQSFTCYDIAPDHSAVCILDGYLTVRKAVISYCSTNLCAALVVNATDDGTYEILTLTDCLHMFCLASKEPQIANMYLKDFYAQHFPSRKKVVYSTASETIWSVAKMFRLNRVHRIPIVSYDPGRFIANETNLIYFLSLRRIFSEVIFKLKENKIPNLPNLRLMTLKETGIGTWKNIAVAHEETPCGKIVDILLTRKISCLALVNEDGWITGIVTKNDVMAAISNNRDTCFEVNKMPAADLMSPHCLNYLVGENTNLEAAMEVLYESGLPCLFVVDPAGERAIAVISYADIMDFLLKLSEEHEQKKQNGIVNNSRQKMHSLS